MSKLLLLNLFDDVLMSIVEYLCCYPSSFVNFMKTCKRFWGLCDHCIHNSVIDCEWIQFVRVHHLIIRTGRKSDKHLTTRYSSVKIFNLKTKCGILEQPEFRKQSFVFTICSAWGATKRFSLPYNFDRTHFLMNNKFFTTDKGFAVRQSCRSIYYNPCLFIDIDTKTLTITLRYESNGPVGVLFFHNDDSFNLLKDEVETVNVNLLREKSLHLVRDQQKIYDTDHIHQLHPFIDDHFKNDVFKCNVLNVDQGPLIVYTDCNNSYLLNSYNNQVYTFETRIKTPHSIYFISNSKSNIQYFVNCVTCDVFLLTMNDKNKTCNHKLLKKVHLYQKMSIYCPFAGLLTGFLKFYASALSF